MKKRFTFFVMLLASFGFLGAADLPLTFETGTFAFTDFDGGGTTIIDNPQSSGINTSLKVGKMVKSAGQPWGGSWIALDNPINFTTNKTFKMKVFSPRVGAKVLLKVENLTNGGINYEKEALTTVANAWEELTFDYSFISTTNSYQKVTLIFELGTMGDGTANFTFLFDDIKLVSGGTPSEALTMPVDFESTTLAYTFTNFDGGDASVVANPQSSGINTSAKVGKLIRSGGQPWGGSVLTLSYKIDFTPGSTISMKVFSTRANVPIVFKLEGDAGANTEKSTKTTVANQWETLTWDFTGTASNTYQKLVFMFDFGTIGDGSANSTFLFDDIKLIDNSGGLTQIDLPVNFESTTVSYAVTDFGGNATVLGTDPANASNKVAVTTKTAGAETWAGTTIGTALGYKTVIPFTANEKRISVNVYPPASGIVVRLKVEAHGNAALTAETEATTTAANAWQTMVFNFANVVAGTNPFNLATPFDKMSLFFNFGAVGTAQVFYWDNVRFGVVAPTSASAKLTENVDVQSYNGTIVVNCGEELLNGMISVYDLTGRRVVNRTISNTTSQFNLDKQGIYVIRVSSLDNQMVFSKKMFIN